MKIFQISVNVNVYQWLCPVEDTDEIYDLLNFDCTPKKDTWKPIELFVFNPKKKKGNFYSLSDSGAFVCDKKALDELSSFLGFGSELLPVFLEDGTELYIVNVLDCVNALDQKKSEFDYYDDGTKGRILKHSFHKNRFSESSIFKIPETCSTQILTYNGVKSPEDEFITTYNGSKLEGLEFQLLYSDEG